MSKSYVVAPGMEFSYPADATSLQIVSASGGVSKLSAENKQKVRFKTVTEGQDCSDMPQKSLEIFLERGSVIEVETKLVAVKEVVNG